MSSFLRILTVVFGLHILISTTPAAFVAHVTLTIIISIGISDQYPGWHLLINAIISAHCKAALGTLPDV